MGWDNLIHLVTRTLKTQERKELRLMPRCIRMISLREQLCLISLQKVASLLMHERQRNSLTVRQRNPEEVCVPPWKPGCYISCYATQQPASQSAVPVWGERSTSASSARRTFNWPHVTAAPLSPSCFWAFPDFSCFPIPLCHFPSYQSSDEK